MYVKKMYRNKMYIFNHEFDLISNFIDHANLISLVFYYIGLGVRTFFFFKVFHIFYFC